jgi:hypothetical protein
MIRNFIYSPHLLNVLPHPTSPPPLGERETITDNVSACYLLFLLGKEDRVMR